MLMDKRQFKSTPELWGGLECSFNRVGDLFMDQLDYSGHYERGEADIESFASLGISSIRYPVIWEKHQPALHHPINWEWTEKQLHALQRHNIDPVATLMHHGNGPQFTDLLSSSFPSYFEHYAEAVARKFPWLTWYTPINEPLTTARFSGLYGIWHPHKKHDRDFAVILFSQMKATVLAMRAIRRINPQARFLQTEDLSKTYSTPLLQYQADFENERRWLTYDILCGRLDPGHALWDYFKWLKIPDDELYFFLDNPCPPDRIGADHYLTSERFLDQNLEQYPEYTHGGNRKHRYADVEAIRVKHSQPWGLKMLLKECWNRFQIPIAITEAHINGNSDDQIRWFREVWDIGCDMLEEGIPIEAVTSWSLLGSYGWNNLLTMPHGHYEPGAFDVQSGKPENTALATFLKGLSADASFSHPALEHPGWWQQESRCFYNVSDDCVPLDVEERVMTKNIVSLPIQE
jgi:dTDP-4-dehydrorhamnose reductase